MARIEYTNGLVVDPAVIQVWNDLHAERSGYFRAFWTDGPDVTSGSTVIGYCSAGGSHRTITAVVAEVRRMGYTDPIYRNGKLIATK